MKKQLFCLVIITLFAVQASAQNPNGNSYGGFYTRLDVGYGFPHAGDVYNNGWPIAGTETYTVATGVSTIDYGKSSFSSGLNLTLGAGYMFNPHFGVDLGVRVGVAPKKYVFDYSETSPGGTFTSSTTTNFNTPLYIMPSLLFTTGADKPLSIYTRMGVALPIGGKLTGTYTSNDDFLDEIYDEEEEYDFYMSKGLQGALGVNYGLSSNLRIYGEVNGMSMMRFAKSSEVVAASTNGVDELSTWTPAQRNTFYDPQYTYDPMTSATTTSSQANAYGIPASNFGVTIGAQMNLGAGMSSGDTMPNFGGYGFYGRVGLGYSLPHAGNYNSGIRYGGSPISGSEVFNTSTGVRTVDLNKASYSSGVTGVVAGGYMFNPHIGFELGIGINVAPKKYEFTYQQEDTMGVNLDHLFESYSRRSVNIMPAIVVSTGSDKDFSAYGRAGLVLPIGGKMTGITTTTNHMTNDVSVEEELFDFYMSKGLQGAVGAEYKLSDNLGLWAEINGTSLTRYTKSSEIVAYTINGTDQLSLLTTDQRQTQYEYQSTFDPATNTATQPGKAPVASMPYSNWGIVFGASLRF